MGSITDMRIRSDEMVREVATEEVIASINVTSAYIGEWAKGKGFRDTEDHIEFLERFADEFVRLGDKAYGISESERAANPDYPRATEAIRNRAAVIREIIVPHLRLLEAGNKHMLIVTEIAEMHEELRTSGDEQSEAYGEETADAIVRLLDRAQAAKVKNLGYLFVQKLKKNATRPHKHGRRF